MITISNFLKLNPLLILGCLLSLTTNAVAYSLYNFDTTLDLEAFEKREIISEAQNDSTLVNRPYVILVSLDGFRHDYAEKYGAKNLLEMMNSGSYVKSLIPAFPSKTFPNHYTIATGQYPANHGLVSNTFFSRSRGMKYSIGNREAVRDADWYGGIPLWSLAESQGMRSASLFWVGSEAKINGYLPSRYFHFDAKIPYDLRVDKIHKWLQLPESKRPHLMFLYFSLTDSAAHRYGPDHPETGKSVLFVDKQIGRLRSYIAESGLPINLMVVSDHGMAEISQQFNINHYVDIGENQFVGGSMAMIYTSTVTEQIRIYNALQKQNDFAVYLKGALPDYLQYENDDRVGDIVLITNPPNGISRWDTDERAQPSRFKGNHGFDPYLCPEMGGIFIAEGPSISPNKVLSPVENIHIYPFVAEILSLKYDESKIDGKKAVLAPLLRQ